MYRINFYPEYRQRRGSARRRTLRTGILTAVVALEAVVVIVMIITGVLLGERSAQLHAENARLAAQAHSSAALASQMTTALELLRVRQARLDWAPVLAAIAGTLGPDLTLTSIRARRASDQGRARLELTGSACGGGSDLRDVPRFMETLRADAVVQASLPEVELGTMEQGIEGRFKITCEARKRPETEGETS